MAVVIPDWISRIDPSGQIKPEPLATIQQQSAPTKTQLLVAGKDSYIPILYGGEEALAGKFYCGSIYLGRLVYCVILGEGEFEEIGDAYLNDQLLVEQSVVGNLVTYTNGITITKYRGTSTQGLDPTMPLAIPGFDEPMQGTAYAVISVPAGVTTGFPRITLLCKGSKVFDPRTTFYEVQSSLAIPDGWANFGTDPGYGPNSALARDGSLTAHHLTDLNADASSSGGRQWVWTVANDQLTRSISISINKDPEAPHQAGVGIAYSGGSTPLSVLVRLNLALGTTTVVSGAGGVRVNDRTTHWEVILSLQNNATGNTSFTLKLYPAL